MIAPLDLRRHRAVRWTVANTPAVNGPVKVRIFCIVCKSQDFRVRFFRHSPFECRCIPEIALLASEISLSLSVFYLTAVEFCGIERAVSRDGHATPGQLTAMILN